MMMMVMMMVVVLVMMMTMMVVVVVVIGNRLSFVGADDGRSHSSSVSPEAGTQISHEKLECTMHLSCWPRSVPVSSNPVAVATQILLRRGTLQGL